MLLSLTLGTLSAIFGAAANLSARRVLRFASARETLALNFAVIALLLIPFLPFFWQLDLSTRGLAFFTAAVLIDAAGNYAYFKAFEQYNAADASAGLALSPLFSLLAVILAAAFGYARYEALTLAQAGGILLVVVGLLILSRAGGRAGKARLPWYAILAAFLFGLNVYLVKALFSWNITNPLTYYSLRAVIISLLMAAVFRPRLTWLTRPRFALLAGRAVLVIAQWLLLLYALQAGSPAVVNAAGSAAPLFVTLAAPGLLGERIVPAQIFGCGVLIAGLVLLTLG